MVTTYTYKDLTWVDLSSPTKEEIRTVQAQYGFNPFIADDLIAPSPKASVSLYQDAIYLVLHFAAFKHTHHLASIDQEIDFIIGKNYLITVRYDMIDALHKFTKVFEVNTVLGKHHDLHAGFIFFQIMKKLYRSLTHEIDYFTDELQRIEKNIFDGKERDMVADISRISRNLLALEHSLVPHDRILRALDIASTKFFGEDFSKQAKSIIEEYHKVRESLLHRREFLVELRDTNNSLVSTKQNEIMKVLTIMAFVTFPLSLIASIFGMNTTILPIVGHPGDFWIVIGIMGILTLTFFIFFKYKRWL